MVSYVARARLRGHVPRFAGGGSGAALIAGIDPESIDPWVAEADEVELVGRPIDEMIGEWLASIGEAWSQLTFFLFDPESWR